MKSGRAASSRPVVLFLCVENSISSQIAEGLMKDLFSERYYAVSAGTMPLCVHPTAIEVMREIGVDISQNHAKELDEIRGSPNITFALDLHSYNSCRERKKTVLFRQFPDLTHYLGNRKQELEAFRKLRDSIRDWLCREFGESNGNAA